MKLPPKVERCQFCNCLLQRENRTYATATLQGRSHATRHHLVAERFFGRSSNRRGTKLQGLFAVCPWGAEGVTAVFCYECHEVMLHNPVLLAEDIQLFSEIIKERGLDEDLKTEDQSKLAGRVLLFHEVVATGLRVLKR